MLYKFGYGEPLALTNYVWYIEGTKEKTLVDAGGSGDFFSKVRGVPVEYIQTLDAGLSKLGVSCSDIDLIILTHLHHDHVAQASRFSKARFLIQKEELQFAYKPHPVLASAYVQEFFKGLNFEVVDGDVKICDEISVIKTPGHSPAGQSVLIKTTQGIAIISGLCTTRENFKPPLPLPSGMSVIPPTTHMNVMDAYDSLVRIKQIADIVVPLHDSEYPQEKSIP